MLSPYNVITYCHVFFTHPSVVVGHLERIYRLAPENSTEKNGFVRVTYICSESYWKQSTHSVGLFIELQIKEIQNRLDLQEKRVVGFSEHFFLFINMSLVLAEPSL